MNSEVAIKVIENEKACVNRQNDCKHECRYCDLVMTDTDVLEGYDMAIEALEYRTPKDVIKRADKGTDGKPIYIYECPTCKRVLRAREGGAYCRFCGQALDWTDIKEAE